MKDEDKTKEQLIKELMVMRKRIAKLERLENQHKRTEKALKESEERYHTLFEDSRDAVYITTREGKYIDFNQSMVELFGYTREEMMRLDVQKIYAHSVDREMFQKEIEKKGSVRDYEVRLRKKNGTELDCLVSATIRKDNSGKILGYQGIIRDITKRKRMEKIQTVLYNIANAVNTTKDLDELFKIIHKQLGTVIDTTNFYIALYDKDNNVITAPYYVDQFTKLKPPVQILKDGYTAYVIRSAKTLYLTVEKRESLIKEGKIAQADWKSKIWIGVPLKTENKVIGAMAVQSYTDASLYTKKDMEILEFVSDEIAIAIERKQAEENLQQSEEKYRTLIDNIQDGVFIIQGVKMQFVNEAFARMIGYTMKEVIGMDFQKLVAPEDLEMVTERYFQRQAGKDVPREYEFRMLHKDGKTRVIVNMNVGLITYQGRVASMGTVKDITDRKQTEEALKESEKKYRTLVESMEEGIEIVDEKENFIFVNRAAANIFGYSKEELIGKNIIDFTTPEEFQRILEQTSIRKSGKSSCYELSIIRKDGESRIVRLTASPMFGNDGKYCGYFGIFRDITDIKRMEYELQKTQKLESIGILAGGIAHDFNNILTAILGNISLVKMYVEPGDKIFERLTDAEKASLQAKDLTQQLLTFSRGGAPIKKIASISEIIKDCAQFALRGSNVKCKFSIPDKLWPVEVDKGQISQVINNLIINANHAMPEGGTIDLILENVIIKSEDALPLEQGKYVKITIKDSGIGIPEEHLQKIFDPYFSTKQKGSGLGLATAYSIVKRHNGYITVESELGVGTSFYIYLPASEKKIIIRKREAEKMLTGEGRILLMDDEKLVRQVAGEMLKQIGYEVEFAKDGSEAIQLYQKAKNSGQPFDVVIMDLTVPGGMGGKEAIKQLIKIEPNVKAIVSSGYSTDPVMANFKEYGFSGIAIKPYKIEELGEVLKQVITESAGSRPAYEFNLY